MPGMAAPSAGRRSSRQRGEQRADGHGAQPDGVERPNVQRIVLFTANDADGDSLLYFFYDNSAAATSGHFEINGVTQAAGTTFAVSQAQLAHTTFIAGTTGDDLFVNAWDGVAFSGPKEFHVDLA